MKSKVNEEGIKQASNFNLSLVWFGAAISIAEIQTGALLGSLGLVKGILAIITGHVIGAVILYLAGIIGANTKYSAMESTRISFGTYGSYGFSILNILQLIGWTAIMIINGARALDLITGELFHYQNEKLWCLLIAILICIWIVVGIKNLTKVNSVVVGLLFVLSIVLSFIVFNDNLVKGVSQSAISFGSGVELNVAMVLSWLPLIADYTRYAKEGKKGTMSSVISYFAGSTFMFIVGLGAAIYAGTSDISAILLSTGLGIVALFIILFSTVTTTFLDAYSAGVSAANLNGINKEKNAALLMCLIGLILAVLIPINQYENFLYLIGSVFAPLFAILFTDYFVFKQEKIDTNSLFNLKNTIIWIIGVIIYRIMLAYNSPVGITLPVIIIIGILSIIINVGVNLGIKRSDSYAD